MGPPAGVGRSRKLLGACCCKRTAIAGWEFVVREERRSHAGLNRTPGKSAVRNRSSKSLSQVRGYASPRPSQDCSQVAFLRDGHLGILNVATSSVRVLPGKAVYERLYGWDETTDTLLAVQPDQTLVRVFIADAHSEPVMTSPVSSNDRAHLEALARMTPSPGILLVRDNNGEWVVMEKRWGVAENLKHFTSKYPIADPSWCKTGIVYIGKGE